MNPLKFFCLVCKSSQTTFVLQRETSEQIKDHKHQALMETAKHRNRGTSRWRRPVVEMTLSAQVETHEEPVRLIFGNQSVFERPGWNTDHVAERGRRLSSRVCNYRTCAEGLIVLLTVTDERVLQEAPGSLWLLPAAAKLRGVAASCVKMFAWL